MTRLALLLLAVGLVVAARIRHDARRWAEACEEPKATGGVVQGTTQWLDEDGCSLVVPMTAWDGTATYNPNAHTIRIRWMPTTTEV